MASESTNAEEHRDQGHVIRIVGNEGREKLWIDGVRRSFFVSDDGYNLREDAYAPPQETLLDAAKRYTTSLPSTNE